MTVIEVMMKLDFLRSIFLKSMKNTAHLQEGSDFTFDEIIPLVDRSYSTDENCKGCGTCSKICPVQNIEIVDNKPAWQHHCENCLACIKWCPKSAIHGYGELPEGYHHPDVELSDILR